MNSMKFGGPYTTVIQSCSLDSISYNTKVFNLANLSDTICIKLPEDFPRNVELVGVYNLEDNKKIDFEDYIRQTPYRPWVDIKQALLNTAIGQHIYKLEFTINDNCLGASCWFSYIIQDNNPEKPYIYMKRDSDDGSDDDSSEEVK